jgi:hypothetical protein
MKKKRRLWLVVFDDGDEDEKQIDESKEGLVDYYSGFVVLLLLLQSLQPMLHKMLYEL